MVRSKVNNKVIRVKATLLDSTDDSLKLEFRLDRNGYAVKFPISPMIVIWIPEKYCQRVGDKIWDILEDPFKEACLAPMDAFRSHLIMKYGLNPSLVKSDLIDVYPEGN